MMRKRLIMLALIVAGSWMLCSQCFAQAGAIEAGACCREGSPSIPSDQQCVILHQVGPGENLHILAAYYYGDARAWRRIYNLNKKAIRNPNNIMVGQVLRVEVPPCWTPRFDLQEFLRLEERRMQALGGERGPQREIITKEKVETKVTVSLEEEEKPGEKAGSTTTPAPQTAPSVEPESQSEGGGEEGGE